MAGLVVGVFKVQNLAKPETAQVLLPTTWTVKRLPLANMRSPADVYFGRGQRTLDTRGSGKRWLRQLGTENTLL